MPIKLDVDRVLNGPAHQIDYIWKEADCAIVVSNFGENHSGLEADFTAECPLHNEVLSGIRLHLERLGDRKQLTRALLDLPITFKEWDRLVEYAFADTVKVHKEFQEQQAQKVPEAMTADDLLALDLPPTPWLVKDFIIDEGVTILASLPKKGKTVMALNMIKAGQAGEKFLHRNVPPMAVLYLALEDTKARLKHRLTTIGISGKKATFILECDLTSGFDQLQRLIEIHQPKLVVIDTLLAALKIKDENSTELGISAEKLHDLARNQKLAVLILHHHGKTKRDDPLLDLRGHSSLSAAVDVILGLYTEETPGQFKLKSASRDGEPLDMDLAYDGNRLLWKVDEDYNQAQSDQNEIDMLTLLGDLGKVDINAICTANGKTRQANDKVLKRLLAKESITRKASKVGYQTLYVYEIA